MMNKQKILAIKFKFLGDIALMVPALNEFKLQKPQSEIHCLVPQEATPLLEHIPWINKVWAYPRLRGSGQLKQTLPLLLTLRKENFDISIDFVGNDRGAIATQFIDAQQRLGILPSDIRPWWRKVCYTQLIPELPQSIIHESIRDMHILKHLGITPNEAFRAKLFSDPGLKTYAQPLLPPKAIICHLSTTRQKKEWPVKNWISLYKENQQLQKQFVFTTGPTPREQQLLEQVLKQIPAAQHILQIPTVGHLMALIDQAIGIICSDSLPMHVAAGLDKPVVCFFGPTSVAQWRPLHNAVILEAKPCGCHGHAHACFMEEHCLSMIQPSQVIQGLQELKVI